MKIVFIGPFAIYPKGTVPIRILPLAKALQKKGHEVTILLPPYDNLEYSGKSFEVNGIDIHNVAIPRTRLPVKYMLVAADLVKKTLRLQPHIVHIFKPKGYSGLSGMFLILLKFLRLAGFPLVMDCDDWEGHGGFASYYLEHRIYPKATISFFDFQERWLIKHADVITVASRTLESRALGLRGASDHKSVFYLPNGPTELPISVGSKTPAEIRENVGIEGKRVVLLYTRFFEYDVREVLRILARVIPEIQDIKLLVVGKGEFGEEERLLELARESGLLSHIMYVGWVRPEEIRSYIEASDIAIYPFDDTLLNRSKCPGKLVQLMSMGKPIVADAVGQISEYLKHGKSGMLAEPGNEEQFAGYVVELLRNRKLRKRIGENARRRIWESFNWKKLAENVALAYELALKRN